MRVEVICQNRLGILHSIMGILVEFRINLAKGEVGGDDGNAIYFYAPGMLKAQYFSVKPMIEKLPGVRRVRRISLMPSERRHSELKNLLGALDHPVLSINTKGHIIAANLAAARAFNQRVDEVPGLSLPAHVNNVDLMLMIERHNARFTALPLVIRGKTWLADIAPIYADDIITANPEASLAGAVITLTSLLPARQGELDNEDLLTDGFGAVYPHGRPMVELVKQAKQYAELGVPLLIRGEDGAGKERLARACHMASRYAAQPFNKIHCGGVGDQEFKGQLERFSPDNKEARGTLYVSDVHRLSPRAQIRLVEFCDQWSTSGKSIRVIVSAVEQEDSPLIPDLSRLFGSYLLRIPPLRERQDAWGELIGDVLDMTCKRTGKPMPVIDDSAKRALKEYHWPENVRELERVLLQTVLLTSGNMISRADLKLPRPEIMNGRLQLTLDLKAVESGYRDYLDYVERELLEALYPYYPSVRLLGRRLGMSHTAMANRLRRFGIPRT